MKGLDGIQGPIYVGTGCVFRRQAFYEYDASTLKTTPRKTCNYWPKWCYCVCLCFKLWGEVVGCELWLTIGPKVCWHCTLLSVK